jgi:hypothetical protein
MVIGSQRTITEVDMDRGGSGLALIGRSIRWAGSVSLLFACLPVFAGPIYSYMGHPFTLVNAALGVTLSDRITGWVETSGSLAANLLQADVTALIQDYEFSDGINFIDSASTSPGFVVTTDAAGRITDWNFTAWNCNDLGVPQVETSNTLSGLSPCGTAPGTDLASLSFTATVGQNFGVPGTWSLVVAAVPEPNSANLLGLSAAVFGAMRVRRRATVLPGGVRT